MVAGGRHVLVVDERDDTWVSPLVSAGYEATTTTVADAVGALDRLRFCAVLVVVAPPMHAALHVVASASARELPVAVLAVPGSVDAERAAASGATARGQAESRTRRYSAAPRPRAR